MFGFPKYKKDESLSDLDNILKYMRQDPDREYLVSEISDFMGYESGTRIGDLCRKGLVHRTGTKIGKRKHQNFALYSLIK